MKSDFDSSLDSMSVERGSLKLRILILVVNTADLINERATPTLGISHAIISPIAIFSIYVFIGLLIVGVIQKKFASYFLQSYAAVACCFLQIYLSVVVFKGLGVHRGEENAALVLNGVLPMLITFLIIADLIMILLTNRNRAPPVLPQVPSPNATRRNT